MLMDTYPQPVFSEAAAVVLASDAKYAAPLGAAITSLALNASPDRNYDLIVLWPDGQGLEERRRLAAAISGRANFSLRFFNMERLWADLPGVGPENLYIGETYKLAAITYYRLFIASVLKAYPRALYFDPDMIFLGDIGELADLDTRGKLLWAARDHWAVRVLRAPYGRFLGWLESLELSDPGRYFNAGTLVMDLDKWRRERVEERCVERLLRVQSPMYYDQDILNHVCQADLELLDPAWNCLGWWGKVHGDPNIEDTLPADLRAEYEGGLRAPKIIHYLNNRKPWMGPYRDLPLAAPFQKYAALSPFAAELKDWKDA